MKIQTSQLLEKLSSGYQLTVDELNDLVTQKVKEDQFLEYKSGLEIEDGNKDASKTIRDYICGFANSDGGILIIGVDAPSGIPTKVDGCQNHKKGDLAEWAARCLTEIASHFSPLPKFQVLNHPNGAVLIGVAQRSLNLISQIEDKRVIYNLRFHDQTLKAPEYLMADLLLGRKQRPDFDVINCIAINFSRYSDINEVAMDLMFDLRIQCESSNVVWAEDSIWGIIAWNQFGANFGTLNVSKPSSYLLSFVDVQELPVENQVRPGILLHVNNSLNIRKPFDVANIVISLNCPIRHDKQWFSYNWMAALYIVAQNSPPSWYQIELKINNDSIKWVDENTTLSMDTNSEIINITKLISERPIVGWRTST